MESVIATGDTTLIQKAIGLALRSDDASLHNLALRAYVASIHELAFEISFPERLRARMEAAELDPEAEKALQQSMPWIAEVQSMQAGCTLVFSNIRFPAILAAGPGTQTETTGENGPLLMVASLS